MSRFANLADKQKVSPKSQRQPTSTDVEEGAIATASPGALPRSRS